MKTLYLMRHAKSSWQEPDLIDHQRPLNKRGKQAAPEMGRRLKVLGVSLDVIVSSDAKRAIDTAAAVAQSLGLSFTCIRQTDQLYDASPDEILDVVYRLEESWKQAMLVGHNPGLTDLANRFSPRHIANIPTAGIVTLQFNSLSWRQIDRDSLNASNFDFPKNR